MGVCRKSKQGDKSRRCAGRRPCSIVIRQLTLQGSGDSFAVAAGNRHGAASQHKQQRKRRRAMPVQDWSRPRGPLRRFTRFLPWSEAASRALVERPGSLWPDAVVASLLLGAVFRRLPKGSVFQNGLLPKVGRLFGWFVPRGFPRTNHPFHLASAARRLPQSFFMTMLAFSVRN